MTAFLRTYFFTLMRSKTQMHKKLFASLTFLMIFIGGLKAQNTSYNLNSVPLTGTDNTAFGFQSLFSNTIGTYNIAVGKNALYSSSNSGSNIAIGYNSLFSTPRSTRNIGIGNSTLYQLLSSDDNVAIGDSSLSVYAGVFGAGRNTALGSRSMINPGFGQENVALGYNAQIGTSFPAINNAVAIGSNSIASISNSIQLGNSSVTQIFGGVGNTAKFITGGLQVTGGTPTPGYVLTSDAVGNATWQPGNSTAWDIMGNTGTVDGTNFIGTIDNVPLNFRVNNQKAGRIDPLLNNSFYGFTAGSNNSTGTRNTAVGEAALALNDASRNTAIGFSSLYNNKVGVDNVAIGTESLFNNADGSYNTASGSQALYSNVSGTENTAIGIQSMFFNTQSHNTALGAYSLFFNRTGSANTAIGTRALATNYDGNQNVAVGMLAVNANLSGNQNVGVGGSALALNSSGSSNTSVGYESLYSNNDGIENTAIGLNALDNNVSGNRNTALGSGANTFTGTLSNSTAIGAYTIVNASNKIRFGDVTVTVIEGNVPYTVSDGRFKTNIKEEDVRGLDFINKLRPVVYNFDTRKFQEFLTQNMPDSIRKKYFDKKDFAPSTAIRQSGFIAQEVEKAAKETGYDFNGVHVPESKNDNYSLAYAEFVVPLVKSVQELSRQNDSLKKEIAEIKAMIIANGADKSTTGSISIAAGEGAKLFQNAPNPFSKSTTIRYTLPDDAKKAIISITNISGVKLKEFDLKSKGGQSIEINGGQLAAGTYIYSLYVDNNLIDSRQMILTK
jgi:hypothetical protein